MKELINYNINYGYINEEMQISDDFNEENFILEKENRRVYIDVGIDIQNEKEHKSYLIVLFTNKQGFEELMFYFMVLDKNDRAVPGLETIYDRKIANKYIPDELKGTGKLKDKIIKMTQKLLNMENPARFIVQTYEDYKDEKQLDWHQPIIDLLLKNGYMLKNKGLTYDKKNYYWEFVQATKETLPEGYEPIKWKPRDKEFYDNIRGISESIAKNIRERNKKII